MRKILLHTCCAPCTTYPNKWLVENGFEVTGYFYNPNIKPEEEYAKRLATMRAYADQSGFRFLFEPNDVEHVSGRCSDCYEMRLLKTAQKAKELGYDCFSTTLLISPYQNHELVREIAQKVRVVCDIDFFYQDFRIGYRESRSMSRELNLFMQKYCGCGVRIDNAKINRAVSAK
ncbi:MAG: epoxyqueuosine reductase QueH [bacterium]